MEYKSTLRTRADSGEVYKPLETMTIKTIAAFLNSRDGGTLLIGVGDDGAPFGLESDYASLRKPDKNDRDLFQQHLANVLMTAMGETALPTSQSRCTRSTAMTLPGARPSKCIPGRSHRHRGQQGSV